jgi:hypothetical protein
MEHLESQLPAAHVVLDEALLDRIDEIVAPAINLEWTPFRGQVRAFAVRPRKDGVRRAPNPTCVPSGVPA